MQRPIQGMTGNDKHVLRLLDESELALRVGDIQFNLNWKYNVDIPESTLYRRLATMDYAGLIIQVTESPSRYRISDLGERHSRGELTDREAKAVERAYSEFDY